MAVDVVRVKDLDTICAERGTANSRPERDDRCRRRDTARRDDQRREQKDERPLS